MSLARCRWWRRSGTTLGEPGWNPPRGCILAFGALRRSSLSGSVRCLSRDPECAPNLGVGRSAAPSSLGREVDCGQDAVSGVSQSLELDQGTLGAAHRALELLRRTVHLPSGERAFLGAHVNGCCHRSAPLEQTGRQLRFKSRNAGDKPLTRASRRILKCRVTARLSGRTS